MGCWRMDGWVRLVIGLSGWEIDWLAIGVVGVVGVPETLESGTGSAHLLDPLVLHRREHHVVARPAGSRKPVINRGLPVAAMAHHGGRASQPVNLELGKFVCADLAVNDQVCPCPGPDS